MPKSRRPGTPVDFRIRETEDSLSVSTAALSIQINKQSAAFTYLDSSGAILAKEPDKGGKTLAPVDVVRSVFDQAAVVQTDHGADGLRAYGGIRPLTGQAPMLPKWAFGYVQSKERYKTQAELIEIVRQYRERGLPLDCIVLDWQSWAGELWGQKSLDPERFPDPRALLDELHDGTRMVIDV